MTEILSLSPIQCVHNKEFNELRDYDSEYKTVQFKRSQTLTTEFKIIEFRKGKFTEIILI